jgi:hypothetical protein
LSDVTSTIEKPSTFSVNRPHRLSHLEARLHARLDGEGRRQVRVAAHAVLAILGNHHDAVALAARVLDDGAPRLVRDAVSLPGERKTDQVERLGDVEAVGRVRELPVGARSEEDVPAVPRAVDGGLDGVARPKDLDELARAATARTRVGRLRRRRRDRIGARRIERPDVGGSRLVQDDALAVIERVGTQRPAGLGAELDLGQVAVESRVEVGVQHLDAGERLVVADVAAEVVVAGGVDERLPHFPAVAVPRRAAVLSLVAELALGVVARGGDRPIAVLPVDEPLREGARSRRDDDEQADEQEKGRPEAGRRETLHVFPLANPKRCEI